MRATTKIRSVAGSRWAAVIVTAGLCAGAFGGTQVSADVDGRLPTTFVAIEPCRLLDTRPGTIGPDETFDVHGGIEAGGCPIPPGTNALALNVTATGATEPTNLRFFPAGGAIPATANLNPRPGTTVTNAVTVGLGVNDHFSVLNRFGRVSVIVDVMGYYRTYNFDDRYYPHPDIDAMLETKLDADRADRFFTSGYDTDTASRSIATWGAGTTRDVSASCPDGMAPTGGGGAADESGLALVSSHPSPLDAAVPTGWTARYRNVTDGALFSTSIQAFVVCADHGAGVS